jgi:hypothetical protein
VQPCRGGSVATEHCKRYVLKLVLTVGTISERPHDEGLKSSRLDLCNKIGVVVVPFQPAPLEHEAFVVAVSEMVP